MGSSGGSRSLALGLPANTWPCYAKRRVSWQSTARHGKSNTNARASRNSPWQLTRGDAVRGPAKHCLAKQIKH